MKLSGKLAQIKAFIDENNDLMGIVSGTLAFSGPRCVQIDLTNSCNNVCIGCWARSPYLLDQTMPPDEQQLRLPYSLVKQLLMDLSRMGTKEIYFGGGGEPLCHPNIWEILADAKQLGMEITVHTNGTLLNKEAIDQIKTIQPANVTVSVWAGTPEGYKQTHPKASEDMFERLQQALYDLCTEKQQLPRVKLYNVISAFNYKELLKMIQFGIDVHADSMEYTLIDPIPGRTEFLLLNQAQQAELLSVAQLVWDNFQQKGFPHGVVLDGFDRFLRRLASSGSIEGEYDTRAVLGRACYIGWVFARIMPEGNVTPCLKGDRYPLGNLHAMSFETIWNSARERRFRAITKRARKRDALFSLIGKNPRSAVGCVRSCDDLGRIEDVAARLDKLSFIQKLVLFLAGRIHPKKSQLTKDNWI